MMTKATHTPGPWEVHEGQDYVRVITAGGHTDEKIADVFSDTKGAEYEDDDANQLANASLIAAAPETAAERDRLKVELAETQEIASNNFAHWKKYEKQRDELLAALKAVRDIVEADAMRILATIDTASEEAEGHRDAALCYIEQVDTAIANAEA